MSVPDFYIIGAGLAGLSCAVHAKKVGFNPKIFEATPKFGGRIRSFEREQYEDAIDNGTHLIIKAYENTFEYLKMTGQIKRLKPCSFEFEFFEPETNLSWEVSPKNLLKSLTFGDVPDFGLKELLKASKIFFAPDYQGAMETIDPSERAIYRFWDPVSLAVFNTPFSVLTNGQFKNFFKALGKSGLNGFTPFLTHEPLSDIFKADVDIEFGKRLKTLGNDDLSFMNGKSVEIEGKPVVCALPFQALKTVEGLIKPPEFSDSPIVNIHFFFETALEQRFCGFSKSLAHWVHILPNRVSVTISAHVPEKNIAQKIWEEIAFLFEQNIMPPFKVITEKQATPLQDRKFIDFQKNFNPDQGQIIYAGDWTVDHLPLTIESAILSGKRAFELVKQRL